MTGETITSPDELRDQLDEIRSQRHRPTSRTRR